MMCMCSKCTKNVCYSLIFIILGVLSPLISEAASSWRDSLYVRIGDAEVIRHTGADAVVVFDIEVFRPNLDWNNNDTSLGGSDFVLGKEGMDVSELFKSVDATPLQDVISKGTGGALTLSARFVLGKLQISLTPVLGSSQMLNIPYQEWFKLCRVELTLKNPETVELGLLWDTTSTGLITSKNIPILESLQDDLDKIPDNILTFEDYSSSQSVCAHEEFFLFAHAISSGDQLICEWQYSTDDGVNFYPLASYAPDWIQENGNLHFEYKISGEHSDTLFLRGMEADASGVIFKCVAEDKSVSEDKRETPAMKLKIFPELQVALEGYASQGDFSAGLGQPADLLERCPGTPGEVRVALYGIKDVKQLEELKGMGGKAYIIYRWVDNVGGTGSDTLKVNMSDISSKNFQFDGRLVTTSDKLGISVEEDGKYYIHKIWTDSCAMGTVLTAYDTVVVHSDDKVVYEFDPIQYAAGSPQIDITEGLDISFSEIEIKSPAIGTLVGDFYSAADGKVGTDTLLYKYQSGGCEIIASRLVYITSGRSIAIKVFLEGPYVAKADTMRAMYEPYFPVAGDKYISPYNDKKTCSKPFPVFDHSVVDWVYVEVWDYPPYGMGNGDKERGHLVDSTSALLLSDGTIVDIEGNKYVSFEHLEDNEYYVLIRHRNHLSILSAKPITFSSEKISSIDFTRDIKSAFDKGGNSSTQSPLKENNGRLLMYAGECVADGMVMVSDVIKLLPYLNQSGYLTADMNFDGLVSNIDRLFILNNQGTYIKY